MFILPLLELNLGFGLNLNTTAQGPIYVVARLGSGALGVLACFLSIVFRTLYGHRATSPLTDRVEEVPKASGQRLFSSLL